MNEIVNVYGKFLRKNLAVISPGKQHTPYTGNKVRYQSRGIFIAAVLYLKYGHFKETRTFSGIDCWLVSNFTSGNLFSSILSESNPLLRTSLDGLGLSTYNFEDIDLAGLYESLLGIESGEEASGVYSKNYRNKLGSYYTPADLAKAVTAQTIEQYFKLNGNTKKYSEITFADFSCGAGNFLLEVIRYYRSTREQNNANYTKELVQIAKNIYAFDVDPIALELAKLLIVLEIGSPKIYGMLSSNFTHSNFLLQNDAPVASVEEKREIFSQGYIYHSKLALDKKILRKYDIILGNPPWEKIRFEKKKFISLHNTIAPTDLTKYEASFQNEIDCAKKLLKGDVFFAESSAGELNTYALFTEAADRLNAPGGVVGLILKSAIVTSQINQRLFRNLIMRNRILAVYDFVNTKKIFQIDSRERFCFLLLGASDATCFRVAMNLNAPSDIFSSESVFELRFDVLEKLNPISGMLPNFVNRTEAEFLLRVSEDLPFFGSQHKVKFGRIVHLNTHAEFITKKQSRDSLPIYEGKFFHQFNGGYAGFNGVSWEKRYSNKASAVVIPPESRKDSFVLPEPRYFIKESKWAQLSKNYDAEFMLAWRSLTSPTNSRTCIATLLPFVPALQSVQFLIAESGELLYLSGLFNSIVFDFIIRKKLSGIDLTQSIIKQIPVPSRERLVREIELNATRAAYVDHINTLCAQLLNEDKRLEKLLIGYTHGRANGTRFENLRMLDLLFIMLYELNEAEVIIVVTEFNQYTNDDLQWFLAQRKEVLSGNAIRPTGAMASARPIS